MRTVVGYIILVATFVQFAMSRECHAMPSGVRHLVRVDDRLGSTVLYDYAPGGLHAFCRDNATACKKAPLYDINTNIDWYVGGILSGVAIFLGAGIAGVAMAASCSGNDWTCSGARTGSIIGLFGVSITGAGFSLYFLGKRGAGLDMWIETVGGQLVEQRPFD